MQLIGRLACVLGMGMLAVPLSAQDTRDRFLTAAIGLSSSRGGDFVERDTYSADVLLGARLNASPRKTWIVGATAGGAFRGGNNLTCAIRPGGECAATMPSVGFAGATAGFEVGGRVATLMLLAGPVVALTTEQATFAIVLRADLSVFVVKRAALVLSARNLTVPNLLGMSTNVHSLGVGLRLW